MWHSVACHLPSKQHHTPADWNPWLCCCKNAKTHNWMFNTSSQAHSEFSCVPLHGPPGNALLLPCLVNSSKYFEVRFSQQCCSTFSSSGMWHYVIVCMVPEILKALQCSETSRIIHPRTQHHIREELNLLQNIVLIPFWINSVTKEFWTFGGTIGIYHAHLHQLCGHIIQWDE
jgi:hypothetical protein